MGHSVAGVHSNLSPMRYVVGHFLHVFTYILLTRVQLFIDKPRPFAQIEIDAGAHAQVFTTEGIPSGTEALKRASSLFSARYWPPRAILGTRRVRKRYQSGTINICKSRLEVHLANTF